MSIYRVLPLLVLLIALALAFARDLQVFNQGSSDEPQDCVEDPAGIPAPLGPEGLPANYLHTCGNRLYDARGREAKITGLNWSGMEDGNYTPGGLGVRKWQEILDQVAALGYNTIRLPFSNQALEPGRKIGGVNFGLNPDLLDLDGLGVLDVIIAGARERGLKIILDRHRPTPGAWSPLWYDDAVSQEHWIADWRKLAAHNKGNDTVIGVDLHNEPRNPATWGSGDPTTDWRMGAELAGNAVLEENPHLLIFVEGIEDHDGDHYWWGGNLRGVRSAPMRLRVPNRVVYSTHDYGPNISDQAWFRHPDFPRNLRTVWDDHWGYIHKEGIAPVVVGEFGGHSVGYDREGQWQRTLLEYLRVHGIGALIWSLNPSWDTGGVLAGDWQTVEQGKQEAYRQILAAPLDTGATGTFGRAPTRLGLSFPESQPSESGRVSIAFRIVNDSPDVLDLSRVELRFWLQAGNAVDLERREAIDSAVSAAAGVQVDLVPAARGEEDSSLRVRFTPRAGTVGRYGVSDEVIVQTPEGIWQSERLSGSYGFAVVPELREHSGERSWVALYLDGQLVWGREP